MITKAYLTKQWATKTVAEIRNYTSSVLHEMDKLQMKRLKGVFDYCMENGLHYWEVRDLFTEEEITKFMKGEDAAIEKKYRAIFKLDGEEVARDIIFGYFYNDAFENAVKFGKIKKLNFDDVELELIK